MKLAQVGITTDGKKVVSGVFKTMDTIGLPLDIICQELKSKGMIPAWDLFLIDAENAGWKKSTALRKLKEIDVKVPEIYANT